MFSVPNSRGFPRKWDIPEWPPRTTPGFDIRSPEGQELLWWCADRLYILLLLVLICATAIVWSFLSRHRWLHHNYKQLPMLDEEARLNQL